MRLSHTRRSLPRPTATLAALLVGLATASTASAQGYGGVQRMPPSVARTVWEGRETLPGFGDLCFGFMPDGTALMCDAKANPRDPNTYTRGTWSQNGDQVQIRIRNCVYIGRITGRLMSGRAQFLGGTRQSWGFLVRLYEERPGTAPGNRVPVTGGPRFGGPGTLPPNPVPGPMTEFGPGALPPTPAPGVEPGPGGISPYLRPRR